MQFLCGRERRFFVIMSEDSFARLNSTMSSLVRSIDLEQEEPAGVAKTRVAGEG